MPNHREVLRAEVLETLDRAETALAVWRAQQQEESQWWKSHTTPLVMQLYEEKQSLYDDLKAAYELIRWYDIYYGRPKCPCPDKHRTWAIATGKEEA